MNELKLRYDYNVSTLYTLIKDKSYDYIDNNSISQFLYEKYHFLNLHEIDGILIRLGTSLKEKITYNEFLTTLTDIFEYQFDKLYVHIDNQEQTDNSLYDDLKSKYNNNLVTVNENINKYNSQININNEES